MKIISYFYFIITFCLIGLLAKAQPTPTDSSASFKVYGACEQCKQRIEKALSIKGVKSADWNVDTKILSLIFDPQKITLEKIHSKVAGVGHDTELKTAKESTYNALPDCCHYREQTQHAEASATEQLPSFENSSTVKGVVLEEDNKGNFKPLEGASVYWLGTRQGTTTDNTGVFTLNKSSQSTTLVVSYSGFQSDTLIINQTNDLKIVLASGNVLKEVRVLSRQASTYMNAYNPFRTAVMTQKELFKAACCNLSESFETNPSVDVSYSDAVTGSKQIQLLGLSGVYTQLTVENLPGPRGLATSLGLNSIAGPWVESIQLTKGIGSVVNGFESIAGQINVELKKPATAEKLYVNGYINSMGKGDVNLNVAQKVGQKWSTAFLLHDDFLNSKPDYNKDGFRDLPSGHLFSGINRWQYQGTDGLMSQIGVKVLLDEKTGGEINFNPAKDKFTNNHYGLGIETKRYEGFGKLGYVFPEKKYKSMGLQLSAFDHHQNSYFGYTTYNAHQQNVYSNFIYQSIIGNDHHKFKTGLSFLYDTYQEDLNATQYQRKEVVPGAFVEYTYNLKEKLDVVAGLRADHNSLFGSFVTPRLNVRYEPVKGTTLRASVGRGQRTANIFAENNGVLVSARQIAILSAAGGKAYGLNPEVAWNKGISLDQKFKVGSRDASIGLDYYRNDFEQQVVVDLEDPRQITFYNLAGKSYSNSFQAELNFTPVQRLDVRLAYRFFDVKTTYGNELLQKPFTAKNRAFANVAYEWAGWKLDYTVNYIGEKRIPSTAANPKVYQLPDHSPAYVLMNAQVSKSLGKHKQWEVYTGAENITNYFQQNIVLASQQPYSPYFDASMIWGPVNGRQWYAGFRYSIK